MLDLLPIKRRHEREFPSLVKEMESMFKNLWEDMALGELATDLNMDWTPRLDVEETDAAIIVRAEIPGVDKKDIDISLDRDTLIIKGEKRKETEEKGKTFHRVERRYGGFQRLIRLPAEVDTTKVEATYKDGVLTVNLPKTEESRKRLTHIEVH